MREHADAAREYERLKWQLAAATEWTDSSSREQYARGKTEFIERIINASRQAGD
ncbi:MAG: hypothetical protein DMF99_22510 [Acidobacteria bacterium]|nr:MAG: hypothetical protein DMF99_22510 [Acidobacteriota bacterium]